MIYLYITIFLMLTWISINDFKTREIPNKYPLMIFLIGIISNILFWEDMWYSFVVMGVMLVSFLIMLKLIGEDGFGGGDIKLILSLIMTFEALSGAHTLFLGMISVYTLVFYVLLKALKKKDGPFAPVIQVAYMSTMILMWLF